MTAYNYDPECAILLSKDPIGYAGGFNLYSYVGTNPVNRTDPLGLYVGGIGGFGSGAISGNVAPGVYGGGSAYLVWDDKGNVGWAICGSIGVSSGAGVLGGLAVLNAWGAGTICDLESVGVGIGAGGAGGAGAAGWGGFLEVSLSGASSGVGYGLGGWAVASGAGGCKVFPLRPGATLNCRKAEQCPVGPPR